METVLHGHIMLIIPKMKLIPAVFSLVPTKNFINIKFSTQFYALHTLKEFPKSLVGVVTNSPVLNSPIQFTCCPGHNISFSSLRTLLKLEGSW